MAPRYLLVDFLVDDTSFLLVVRVDPDLAVGVVEDKGFVERRWTWGEKMFGRDIVE